MDTTQGAEPGSSSQPLFDTNEISDQQSFDALAMEYRATMDRAQSILLRCNELQRNQEGLTPSLFTGPQNAGNNRGSAPIHSNSGTGAASPLLPSRLSDTAVAFPDARGGPQQSSTSLTDNNPPQPRASTPTRQHEQPTNEDISSFLQQQNDHNPFLQARDTMNIPREEQLREMPNHQCRDLIFELERKLILYKNIEYDIFFLKTCVHHRIVPQGLRAYRFPNGITRDSDIYRDLVKLFNDTGLATLNFLINHNQTRLDNLRAELQQRQSVILRHQDLDSVRHLFDRITPKITRHVATLVFRKQKKLDRDLGQYQRNCAYLLNGERAPRGFLQHVPQRPATAPTSTQMEPSPLPTPPPPQAPPGFGGPPRGIPPAPGGATGNQVFPQDQFNLDGNGGQNEQPFLWHGHIANNRRRGRGRGGNRNYNSFHYTRGRMTTRSMTRGHF